MKEVSITYHVYNVSKKYFVRIKGKESKPFTNS